MKWYARDPHRAIEGMSELTLEECGAYNLLLDHAYARDGDLPDDDLMVARMLRCHWRTWKAIKASLIQKEKIILDGSRIVPNGVQNTLKEASRLVQDGLKTGSRPPQESKKPNDNYARAQAQQTQPHTHIKGISKDIPKNQPSDETLSLAVNAWNALAGARRLPKVQNMTKARKASLVLRLSELGGPAGWADLLRKVQASRFLCGENEKGWTADFDWVLKPANLTKIMEGKYDDRKGTSANKSGLAEAFDKLDARIREGRGDFGDSGPDNGGDEPPTEDNRFRNRGDD